MESNDIIFPLNVQNITFVFTNQFPITFRPLAMP